MTKPVPYTSVVRRAMIECGIPKREVFINRYVTCRTVKCYLPSDPAVAVNFAIKLTTVLAELGVPVVEYKLLKKFKYSCGAGLIVRLPKTNL